MAVFDRFLPKRQTQHNVPVEFVRDDFHRAIDEVFRRAWMEPFGEAEALPWRPQVDVTEDDAVLYVTAELPGLDRKDIDVRVERDHLVLRGEKRVESSAEGRGWHRAERSWGSFLRRIPLPFEAEPDQVEATFKNGVLEVGIRKTEETRRTSRKIEVKGSR